MRNVAVLFMSLSLLCFLGAVFNLIIGPYTIMGFTAASPEALSRASGNLALIAIAVTLIYMSWVKEKV